MGPGPLRAVATILDRAWTDPLPILAWLVEHEEGLIVVDTGETARVSQPGYFPAWHPYFRLAVRERVAPEEEIGPQLTRLGFSTADVRWVVLTHLHTDHAGGLGHFPDSEILVTREELAFASGALGRSAAICRPPADLARADPRRLRGSPVRPVRAQPGPDAG